MRINTRSLVVLTLTLLSVASVAPGMVLLQDTFDIPNVPDPTGWDVNYNYNLAGRQSGTLAPTQYAELPGGGDYHHQVGNGGAANQLLIFSDSAFGNPAISPNHSFTEGGVVVNSYVSFDVNPVPSAGGGATLSSWAAVKLGAGLGDRLSNVNDGNPHFGLLIRGNGDYQAFDGGAAIGSGHVTGLGTGPVGYHHFEVDVSDPVDGQPWNGAGTTVIKAFVDSNPTPFYSYTRVGNYLNNYVTLLGDTDNGAGTAHFFDNLQIGFNVPEPSTLLLVGLGAMTLRLFRTRRAGK